MWNPDWLQLSTSNQAKRSHRRTLRKSAQSVGLLLRFLQGKESHCPLLQLRAEAQGTNIPQDSVKHGEDFKFYHKPWSKLNLTLSRQCKLATSRRRSKPLRKEENPKDRPSNFERKSSLKSCSPLFKLDPFIDCSGILRVGGRLKRASMPDNVKFPEVLPRKSHITDLVVKQCHDQVEHQGRDMTLSEVRSGGFWVIGGSAAVAKCISNCTTYRKLGGTVEEQKMADFPLDRSEPAPPFTYSTVDYLGP